ncbi:Hypothetical predicted protein [Paramuricea clavata]|uniref:Uncharacterized protein n=1 Tax=Paramuricea clavata TaxID=317549 RepID=A0A7D9EG35_PARCT|nr:Hypothetical predicted protein [Paramuricea clavata]
MPRQQRNGTNQRRQTRSGTGDDDSIASLRRRCEEEGISNGGRRQTLIARLQQHTTGNVPSATPSTSVETSTVSSTLATQSPALLTDAQLAQIRSIVSESIERSASEIATNAARAAVQAMTLSTAQSHPAVLTEILSASSDVLRSQPSAVPDVSTVDLTQFAQAEPATPYVHGAHDIPASYVKQIQSGEFFDLSKLLPSSFPTAADDEPVVFTLENSVLKVKKSPATQKITSIEQWTTAFTSYMRVLTHKFPTRSQDLLQYLSLIRHAAQTHQGLGGASTTTNFAEKLP